MIELTPKQTEALKAVESGKYSFITFGGAIRGGKSVWGLTTLLILCSIYPKSRWCVIRQNDAKLNKTTIPTFLQLNPSGILKSKPWTYTHPNKSQILFLGENYAQDKQSNWMKGFEVNGFLFEEVNECQKQTLIKAFERFGSWKREEWKYYPNPIILATCNPTFEWFKKLVYDPYKSGNLPEKWLYIPSKITDNVDKHGNSNLDKSYLEGLLNLPKFEYEVFVNGNWDIQLKTGGEFYKSFEIDRHVSECKYDSTLPLHISWDDNVNPYLPVGIFQIKDKAVFMIDEIALETPKNNVKDVCSEIIRRYKSHSNGMFIYGDATAQKADTKLEHGSNFYSLVMQELVEFKPSKRVLASNPSVVMRGNWINAILETQNRGLSITISLKCTNMINDLILLKEASDGTKHKEMATDSKTKVRYQKLGHFSDILDYLLCRAFAHEFSLYQNGDAMFEFSGVDIELDSGIAF